MLGFLEGGNTWNSLSTYSPFNLHRSAGLGLRIYLPIFGLLGLDYGYGFDQVVGNSTANKGQFHFTINKGLDGF
jgi:outer membrane protein insertion porin family